MTAVGSRLPGLQFTPPHKLLAVTGISQPVPGRDEVHVWAWSLRGLAATAESFQSCLALDELTRARRFHEDRHQTRYVFAHGMMRHLLSRYCGRAPAALVFALSSGGKPRLVTSQGPDLRFNLAHSGDGALLAVTIERDVGIDLEQQGSDSDLLEIAQRYFVDFECAAIHAAHPAEREAFLRHWVAKEAVLKADGIGLALPLDRFGVRFTGDSRTAHVTSLAPERLHEDWLIRFLPMEPGWHAAVAARGEEWNPVVPSFDNAHRACA